MLDFSRLLLFLGILIEKSFGTIIPGFVPDPWGKVHEYEPPSASRSATSDNSFGRSSRLPQSPYFPSAARVVTGAFSKSVSIAVMGFLSK